MLNFNWPDCFRFINISRNGRELLFSSSAVNWISSLKLFRCYNRFSVWSLGMAETTSSTYLFQNNIGHGKLTSTCFSTYYITTSAITTDTGEPIGVPWTCWYIEFFHLKCVDAKHNFTRVMMSSGCREVINLSCSLSVTLSRIQSTANCWGMHVKRLLTSYETRWYSGGIT